MSDDASQADEPGRASAAAWAIEHVPLAARFAGGKRAAGVSTQEETLAAPFDAVRLRRYTRDAAAASPLVVHLPDSRSVAQRGRRSGEWLASSLARRLPLTVVVVQIPSSVIDDREAALQALLAAVAGVASPKIALSGVGSGGALAARTAMRARDSGEPVLQRQVLISPDFHLLTGPPATDDALHTSLVARLGDLPATLVQQTPRTQQATGQTARQTTGGLGPGEDLVELLRESGVAVRAIDYPPSQLDWTEYPRAVRSSSRALNDLVAFLERGIVADGFDVVPAWNLH